MLSRMFMGAIAITDLAVATVAAADNMNATDMTVSVGVLVTSLIAIAGFIIWVGKDRMAVERRLIKLEEVHKDVREIKQMLEEQPQPRVRT